MPGDASQDGLTAGSEPPCSDILRQGQACIREAAPLNVKPTICEASTTQADILGQQMQRWEWKPQELLKWKGQVLQQG